LASDCVSTPIGYRSEHSVWDDRSSRIGFGSRVDSNRLSIQTFRLGGTFEPNWLRIASRLQSAIDPNVPFGRNDQAELASDRESTPIGYRSKRSVWEERSSRIGFGSRVDFNRLSIQTFRLVVRWYSCWYGWATVNRFDAGSIPATAAALSS
jgi:hypothetical protein